MGMHHVDGIPIPSGKTVMLEPGGDDIMPESLTADLVAGSSVRLVLTFEHGAGLDVTAKVRAG